MEVVIVGCRVAKAGSAGGVLSFSLMAFLIFELSDCVAELARWFAIAMEVVIAG